MRAALFGDNLEENLKRNEVEDSRTMPDDMAYNFVTEVRHKLALLFRDLPLRIIYSMRYSVTVISKTILKRQRYSILLHHRGVLECCQRQHPCALGGFFTNPAGLVSIYFRVLYCRYLLCRSDITIKYPSSVYAQECHILVCMFPYSLDFPFCRLNPLAI